MKKLQLGSLAFSEPADVEYRAFLENVVGEQNMCGFFCAWTTRGSLCEWLSGLSAYRNRSRDTKKDLAQVETDLSAEQRQPC